MGDFRLAKQPSPDPDTIRIEVASPPTSRFTEALPALAYRDFRLFWLGQLVSLIGTWIQSVAQQWLVLEITGSGFKLGLVTTVQFTPVLIFSLFGGAIADRVSKRNLLLLTQVVSGLLALALGVLVRTGEVRYWHVLVIAGILGTVNAFYIPARQAFVPELVDKGALLNAVALNSAIFNAARVIGPAIGGLLIATIGIAPNFFLNAASYVAVMVSLVLINPRPTVLRRDNEGIVANVWEGVRYIGVTPVVYTILALIGIASLFGMNFTVLLPLLARQTLHVGSVGYGVLMAFWGFGSLTGAILLAFFNRKELARPLIYVGAVTFSSVEIALAFSRLYALSLALMLVIGFFLTLFTTTANTRVLSLTPAHLQGRVMSVYSLMFLGVTPFGSLLAGWIAERFGAPTAFVVGACATLLFTVVTFTLRHAPRFRQELEPAGTPS